jgi:hypothetical protein
MTLDYAHYELRVAVRIWDLTRGLKVTDLDSERINGRSQGAFLIAATGLIRLQRAVSVRSACGQRAVGMRRPDP